jgi:glycosyltransferase involved in cell wall biosynthesis
MQEPEASVLHVLPHRGGGGDTYVDLLSTMSGYRFARVYLAPSRKPRLTDVARDAADVVRSVRGYDVLHVHGEVASALFLPLLVAHRSVVTLHGLHLLRRVSGLRRRAAELNLCAIVRAADRTICVSSAERDALAAVVGPTGAQRAVVVHNGAHIGSRVPEAERSRIREELGLSHTDVVGLWVGSLDERRDPLAVVRAAERTSTPLLVAGDGPLREEVERAAGAHVRILGHRGDVRQLLDAADFFVLMSQREGLSFALVEAMAHGLPGIVADIPENVEAVGDSGVAVPYGDEDAVATALRQLVLDRETRRVLGERARRRAAELFDAADMIARTRALYDEVLVRRGREGAGRSRSV